MERFHIPFILKKKKESVEAEKTGKELEMRKSIIQKQPKYSKLQKGKVHFVISMTNLHDISNAYKRQILPLLFRGTDPSSVFFCGLSQKLC